MILKHFDVLDEDGNGVLDLEDISKLKKHNRKASKIFDRKYTTSMTKKAVSFISSSSHELPKIDKISEGELTHVANNSVANTITSDTLASIEKEKRASQPGYQCEENEGDSLAPAHEDSTSATWMGAECSSSKPRANGFDYLDVYDIDGSQTTVDPRSSGMNLVFSSHV